MSVLDGAIAHKIVLTTSKLRLIARDCASLGL